MTLATTQMVSRCTGLGVVLLNLRRSPFSDEET